MMNATTGFLSRAAGRPVDRAWRLALALGAGLALAFGPTGRAEADGPIDEAFFETRVRPILAGTCFRCHGGQKVGGGLRVDGREALLRGGESGAAVELDQADESLLLQAVRRVEGAPAMPPDAPLPPREVEALTAWVRAGAPWPRATARFESARHWAFQPIRSSAPPRVADPSWLRTSVDPFIRARQEAARVSPAPEADRRTLIRRLTYDLTGLPPTPDEVAAFERDSSPHAYEALVDRLLASPRYGEHWGRHWLDVVRYADTAGENSDHPLPHAWRYRNWVIQAFNRRLPFDQFLQEQLAGDLLGDDASPGESHADRVVATGYLALARRFGHDIDKDVHLTYEDAIDTLGKSVLGLTLGCARCHDHKYDPLTTRDYYGLYGIFASTRLSFPGCEPNQQPRDLVPLLTPQEQDRVLGPARRRAAALEAEIKRRTDELSSLGRDLDSRAKAAARLLSQGVVPDSGSRALVDGAAVDLGRIAVRSGDLLLLSVGPRGSHGADSTRVDLTLRELGGNRAWSTADLVPDLLTGNPSRPAAGDRAAWFFLDRQDGLTLLPERVAAIDGRPTLQAWRNGDTPSVFVNTSDQPVSVWTSLPPRAFFLHPGPRGAVALAWAAPGDATLALDGRVADAHPGATASTGGSNTCRPPRSPPTSSRQRASQPRSPD
ncbi:MAG: DUF1549 domain-containing protein [Isosphaeraceae bacterium]